MKRRYRSSEQVVGIAIIGSVVTIIMLVQAIVAFNQGAPWWLISAIAFLFAILSWRGANAAVYAEQHGVRVVNPLRTELVNWSEIERFTLGRYGPWPHVGLIELRNGSRRHIFGIQAPNPLTRPKNRGAQILVEQLNQELAAKRGPRLPTTSTEPPSAPTTTSENSWKHGRES
jgi:Bacterial PH domain